MLSEDNKASSSQSILVIEDDDCHRSLIAKALISAGYSVMEAVDGQEGIKLYRKTQTDLVITDLVMPEKDGLEVISQLRSSFPHVKIIAISGGGKYGAKEYYLRLARAFTVTRTLEKPFEMDALLKIVREVLEEES